mgnify:CR=1 FL=1
MVLLLGTNACSNAIELVVAVLPNQDTELRRFECEKQERLLSA